MEPDRGFVENIHDTDQAGTDLAGQPYPLCFAAGERVGAAFKCQVLQAHIDQELQPLPDFLRDLFCNLAFAAG